jgi:dihydrofolate reductase
MRRIVVSEFVSVDGVMEGPGPQDPYEHAGWTFKYQDPEGMKYKFDEVMEHDALLLGRVTYEGFAAAWPNMKDEYGFADKMNSMPKYVVSTTLRQEDLTWQNSTVIGENVPEKIAELKQQEGGDILVAGSSVLIGTLVEHDLVDEFRLMTYPVVLGSGKRVFAGASHPLGLKLVDVQRYGSGTLTLTYHPDRAHG